MKYHQKWLSFLLFAMLGWTWSRAGLAVESEEEQIIEQFNALELSQFRTAEISQKEIDELFSKIERNKFPRAWLHGFTLAKNKQDPENIFQQIDDHIQMALKEGDLALLVRLILWKTVSIRTRPDSESDILRTFALGEALCPESSSSIWCGRLYDYWAYYYYDLNDGVQGLKTAEKAMAILKRTEEKYAFFLHDAQSSLAQIFASIGEGQQAAKYTQDNYAWYDQQGFHSEASMEALNMVSYLSKTVEEYQQGQLTNEQRTYESEVLQWLDKSKKHSTQTGNNDRIRRSILFMQMRFLFKTGKYAEALPVADEARALYLDNELMDFVALCGIIKARSLMRLGRLEEALSTLDQAEILVPENYEQEKMVALEARIEWAEKTKRYDQAFTMLRKYHDHWKKKKEGETKRGLNRLNVELGLKMELERNESLKRENERQKEKIREAETIRLFLIILGILAASTLGFLVLALRQTRKAKNSQSQMQRILDNIDEGLLTFDRSYGINDGYSKRLPEILGSTKSLIGQNVLEVIFSPSQLSAEEQSIIHEVLEVTFHEDRLAWDLNSENLCRELRFNQEQVLELRWIPIFDGHDRMERLLLSLTDVTEHKAMEAAFGQQRRYLQALPDTLKEMLVGQPQHIARLLDATQEVLEKIQKEALSASLLRSLHTQKGIARALGLKALSHDLHDLETILQPKSGQSLRHSVNEHLKGLHDRIGEYRAIAEVLKSSHDQHASAQSSLTSILQAHVPSWVAHMKRGGMALNKLTIVDSVLDWDTEHLQILEQVCVHAVNNSLDHGFLEADTIIPHPAIEIAVVSKAGFIHLDISDNGQGLNLTRLTQLAQARGFVPKSRETIADVVFCDGLTLAKSVSLSSGRGVGLAAVKELIEKIGGEVHLQNRPESSGSVLRAAWPVKQVNTLASDL